MIYKAIVTNKADDFLAYVAVTDRFCSWYTFLPALWRPNVYIQHKEGVTSQLNFQKTDKHGLVYFMNKTDQLILECCKLKFYWNIYFSYSET